MYMAKDEDLERAKVIILQIINRRVVVDNIELTNSAKEILEISYSIGGGYDASTIRQIAEVKVKEWYNL